MNYELSLCRRNERVDKQKRIKHRLYPFSVQREDARDRYFPAKPSSLDLYFLALMASPELPYLSMII